MDDKTVKRYSYLLNKIGIRNLTVLPEETKNSLKATTDINKKIKLLEEIVESWERQGLI